MARFSVTYETWTPDDTEIGDTDDKGFISRDVSLRDALYDLGGWGDCKHIYAEASCSHGNGGWFTVTYDEDIRTGATEYRSLHPSKDITPSSWMRLARFLHARR